MLSGKQGNGWWFQKPYSVCRFLAFHTNYLNLLIFSKGWSSKLADNQCSLPFLDSLIYEICWHGIVERSGGYFWSPLQPVISDKAQQTQFKDFIKRKRISRRLLLIHMPNIKEMQISFLQVTLCICQKEKVSCVFNWGKQCLNPRSKNQNISFSNRPNLQNANPPLGIWQK